MEKMKMQTPDLTDKNIAKIRELFPDCVTESKDENGKLHYAVDFDQLRQALSSTIVEGPQERYRLDWPGKREALLTANTPINKTLRPCREESVDFDTTENLFIEGDNLDALKLLQETYLGKVKMIYIDPPYNTGKDFIYKDKFAVDTEQWKADSGDYDDEGNRLVANTESNGRFHSDWLSMMYSRLKLARNLLRDDGVIFVSIDDYEQPSARKICDEIFGGQNFIANVIWQRAFSPKNDAKYLSENHDYILLYSKSADLFDAGRLPRTEEANARYKNPDNDPRGVWISDNLTVKTYSEKYDYPITTPSGRKVMPAAGRCWSMPKEKMQQLINDNRIWFGADGGNVPRLKRFLSEVQTGMIATTLWMHQEVGHNQEGRQEVKSLFNDKGFFDSPKPVRLIERILKIANTQPNDIILDFFAGSATTAHAVMQLNAEDGGQRKFIMVQLPEPCDEKSEAFKAGYKTIAEIAKERIRRAGKKILSEFKPQINTDTHGSNDKDHLCSSVSIRGSKKLDTGFRVLKVDSSNMADVYYRPDAITQNELFNNTDNIKPDRTAEDLLFQVLLDWGVDLTLPITKEVITTENIQNTNHEKEADKENLRDVRAFRGSNEFEVFFVDGNALVACFETDGKITEDFCKELAKRQPLRVVFRDAGFAGDAVKINVEQIFKLMSPHTEIKTI